MILALIGQYGLANPSDLKILQYDFYNDKIQKIEMKPNATHGDRATAWPSASPS